MAAPNLLNTSTVTGKTAISTLSTVTSNIITNSASSNAVNKLNSILLSNYSGVTVTSNVFINRSGTTFYVGATLAIPSNSTLVVLGKDTTIYLEEGDVLQANVSSNTSVSMIASYELMS